MRKKNDQNSPFHSETGSATQNSSFINNVRQRAYELYECRITSNSPGDPMSDWLQAEEQVRSQFARGNDILTT